MTLCKIMSFCWFIYWGFLLQYHSIIITHRVSLSAVPINSLPAFFLHARPSFHWSLHPFHISLFNSHSSISVILDKKQANSFKNGHPWDRQPSIWPNTLLQTLPVCVACPSNKQRGLCWCGGLKRKETRKDSASGGKGGEKGLTPVLSVP